MNDSINQENNNEFAASGRAEESGVIDVTGLDLIQTKARNFVYLRNKSNGRIIQIDPVENRMNKLRRKIFAWADIFKELQEEIKVSYVFQGLTYKPGEEWKPGQIREYIRAVKKEVENKGVLGYAWVAELQRRGAVHYHILWAVTPGLYLPLPDKSGIWKYGSSRVSKRNNMQGRSHYLCKYLSRVKNGGQFPKGCRIYGVHINKELLSKDQLWWFRMTNYPRWLQEIMVVEGCIGNIPKRANGGGWIIDSENGIVVNSEWIYEGIGGIIPKEKMESVE
jgi:hypothetical protein